MLLVDVDRFKEINDTHGHAAGDDALRRTAAVLARSVRGTDIVARYAGDEFVIVAPACPPESAVALAGRFRAALAAQATRPPARPRDRDHAERRHRRHRWPAPDRLDDLLHQADEALYHAKRSGRDAVRCTTRPRRADAGPLMGTRPIIRATSVLFTRLPLHMAYSMGRFEEQTRSRRRDGPVEVARLRLDLTSADRQLGPA